MGFVWLHVTKWMFIVASFCLVNGGGLYFSACQEASGDHKTSVFINKYVHQHAEPPTEAVSLSPSIHHSLHACMLLTNKGPHFILYIYLLHLKKNTNK